jgi:hypothetical protein
MYVFLVDLAIIGEGQKAPAGSLDMQDDDENISSLCITCLFLRVLLLTGKKYMEVLLHVCKAVFLFVQWLLIRHGIVFCSTHHAHQTSHVKNVKEV